MTEQKPILIRVRRGQIEASPLTPEEVSIAMHNGDLKPTDEYWVISLSQWRPLAEIERGPLGGLPDRSGIRLQRFGEFPVFSMLFVFIIFGVICGAIPFLVRYFAGDSVGGSALTVAIEIGVILGFGFLIVGGVPFRGQKQVGRRPFTTPTDDKENTVNQ